MIEQIIAGVIKIHTDIICANVKNRWNSMSAIIGKEEIYSGLPTIVGSIVIATINASGEAAFIKEFGSGHLIDTSSPYFAEYKNSDRWNPRRDNDGNEFVGRAKGETVYRPDGTTYQSTGKAEGLRLEHDIGKSGNYPGYKAFLPSHVIQEEIMKEIPELIMHIQQAVASYVQQQLTMSLQIYI